MIVALCPTFRRPRLTCNSVACFLEQTYPGATGMLVLEDGGALNPVDMGNIKVLTSDTRYPDLGSKYNAMAKKAIELFDPTYFAVWEDDDVYLPYHLSVSIKAMLEERKEWAYPSRVYSLLGGPLGITDYGVYHASIVLSRKAWEKVHWDESGQAKFDRIFMDGLRSNFGPPADPIQHFPRPSYVFRFQSTGAYHGQAFMRSLEDKTWYATVGVLAQKEAPIDLVPKFDEETLRLLEQTRIKKKDKDTENMQQ